MAQKVTLTPAVDRWRAACPLRRWLAGQPRGTIRLVQEAAGVTSRQAVYAWMDGLAVPPRRRIMPVLELAGIDRRRWQAWLNRKPIDGDEWCATTSGSRSTP